MITLYKNIKNLREQKGLSQDELAKMIGYTSRSSIAKIEKGEVDLTRSKIIAFAKALEVSPGELMGWEDDLTFTSEEPTTIAAHLDTDDLTEDELNDVANYIEFIKAKRRR